MFKKDRQYYKFCAYGFLKNLRFFEPFFILYLIESGVSFVQIGFLFTVRAVAVNIMEIPSGVIADAVGRRRAMILSFLSYIASFLMFFLFPSFWLIAAAMILFAFGDAFRTGTHKAMIISYLEVKGWEDQRTRYYGNTRSWSQRSSALSALIAAALVFYSGNYRPVFLFTLIPYVAELVLILSYPKFLDGIKAEKKEKHAVKDIFSSLGRSLLSAEQRKSFMSSSVANGYFEAVKDYIQPLLAALALSLPLMSSLESNRRTAVVTGLVYSLIFIMTSAASKMSADVSAKARSSESYLNLTYLASMLLIAASGIFYNFGLELLPIVFFMFYYFLQNLRRPPSLGYLSSKIDGEIMATALSVDSQLKTLWVAILAPLIGLAIDHLQLPAALMLTGASGLLLYPLLRLKGDK